jgi:hypothetical protein
MKVLKEIQYQYMAHMKFCSKFKYQYQLVCSKVHTRPMLPPSTFSIGHFVAHIHLKYLNSIPPAVSPQWVVDKTEL